MATARLGVHRRNKGGRIVKTLCILFLAFILNGIGAYLAYRLITRFETGRIHEEQTDFRPNLKRVK